MQLDQVVDLATHPISDPPGYEQACKHQLDQ